LTLEIKNPTNNTIALKEGMRIVQMTVHELTEQSSVGYDEQLDSKYEGQHGVTPSRLHEDFVDEQ
jgi:deoxycytidine triphosphate deaminase